MRVVVTPNELMEKGKWERFCNVRGWSVYCVNEGRCSGDERIELTESEMIQIGFEVKAVPNFSREEMYAEYPDEQ